MGEVYRARDPRVGRDVAIKISSEHFSDRFEREARAVAALNHPNICILHDVGPNYLVMELVDGESPHGPLPAKTVLAYARQIADALDAAHEKGIVHRDLKPANIKVRPDGTVKVLDFGLAKIATESASDPNVSNSPTLGLDRTQAGTILGTAPYMSPEQARGKPVDKRSDIWAFGVVLYELVTGRRAFDGEDVSTVLAAVIKSEPRWDGVPSEMRRLLESCLQKDPRKRLRDIGDAWTLVGDSSTAVPSRSRTDIIGWIAAAVLVVVAGLAFWAPWRSARLEAPSPITRLDVDLGPDIALQPLTAPSASSLIISPDGRRLVFSGDVSGGVSKLFMRRLDESKVTELAGTQGAMNPFFSPDGQWVAFWDGTKLSKLSLDGGAPVPLAELNVMGGGSWGDDGTIVVGSGIPNAAGLFRLLASGQLSPLVKLESGEAFFTTPRLLPGGRAVLLTVFSNPLSGENSRIDVISIADGHRKTIVRGGLSPRYLPSGHLVYSKGTALFAVPFDIVRQETRGPAVQLLDDLAVDLIAAEPQFDVSGDGTLVYRKNTGSLAAVPMQLQWLDAAGNQVPVIRKAGMYAGPLRLSPDGRKVALTIRDGSNMDIWVYDLQRDSPLRLTFGEGAFVSPVWTPDGRHVVFSSMGKGIFWSRADGTAKSQALLTANTLQLPMSFARDGTRLAFVQIDGSPQIWSVDVKTDQAGQLKAETPTRFLTSQFINDAPAISPDGRWMAYRSNESGRDEVYVRGFLTSSSATDNKVTISNGGRVDLPAWSPNGRELFYLAAGQIMSVAYRTNGDTFVAEKPRMWAPVSGASAFDVAPDGKRLAIALPAVARSAPTREHTIVFVQNFFDELRRRAPITP